MTMTSTRRRLLGLILVTAPMPVASQTSDSVITINVTRTARVPAERSVAYVGVEGNAESAQEAVARATSVMKSVVETLRRTGLVEIGAPMTMTVGDNPALRGYPAGQLPPSRVARAVVRVVASRPEALVQAVAVAIDNGAKGASSTAFESSAADSARLAVLKEAVAAGRQEAEVLAREMGGRLGALLGMGTGGGGPFSQPGMVNFDGPHGSTPQPSEVLVTVTLNLRYRLVR